MRYTWKKGRDTRGFTGIELLLVVVVIGILAGGAMGVHSVLKRRAIHQRIASDLDSYAQAEMSVRAEEGAFVSYDDLLARRFAWSDDVELSTVVTAPDRTFVRIRDQKTGYACALDFSPVTGRARNRQVCSDSAADPALAPPPDVVATAGSADTATVARPPETTPGSTASLLPPDVGDAADEVLVPGASAVVLFPLTNRSAEARSFAFAVTSADPAVAPVPSVPGDVRLQAGETAPVPVSVSVGTGSLADVAAELQLTASDAADRAYSGAGRVRVRAALALTAPAVVSPAAELRDAGETFTVQYRVRNRTNAGRVLRFDATAGAGGALSVVGSPADQAFQAFEEHVVAVSYRLDPAAEGQTTWSTTLRAYDRDASDASTTSDPFQVTVRAVLAAPVLAAYPDITVLPGQSGTSTAALTSRSNVTANICFEAAALDGSAPASAVLSPEPTTPPCVRLPPFGTVQVAQTVHVAARAESPWTAVVSVRAYDGDRPQLATSQRMVVTAGLVMGMPAITVPSTPPLIPWMRGQERTIDYTITNGSNAARELCLAVVPASGGLVPVGALPVCVMVGAHGSQTLEHALRGVTGGEVEIVARVYDSLADQYRAEASFGARVADDRPIALWSASAPAFVRRWLNFDASRSYSPSSARIVAYSWSWGLLGQRWTGSRFEVGGGGVASDLVTTATVQRAYDLRGRFEVCLTVTDELGQRSDPSCAPVNVMAETRARLSYRYRGWWYDPAGFCIDVPWSNQCPKSHGNARWEILLNQSQGDVPIRRAWADLNVAFWQTDDRFREHFSYNGNAELPPYRMNVAGTAYAYDFNSPYYDPSGSVQAGKWRALDTEGTAGSGWPTSPNLPLHPLVLNADLGSATGIFDSGPHWVPDTAWITLHVEDANGNETVQTARLDHDKSRWRGGECINGTSGLFCTPGYERLTPPLDIPSVAVTRTATGSNTYQFTGSGSSPDGRIVDSWWEVTRGPFDPTYGSGTTSTYRGEVYNVVLNPCEEVSVALVYVDDRGQEGRGYSGAARGTTKTCSTPGGPL